MSAARNTTLDSREPINQEEEALAERLETLITDENILTAATIEQASELVVLDKDPITSKWTLSLGHGYRHQWENATENDDISDRNGVFIISVLGNTTAGKSFVTKYLLTNPEKGPHIVDESDIESSTTGNINCYLSKLNSDRAETMLMLDYEGEKGSSFPLMLSARQFFAEHIGFNKDYAIERRKAVTEYFPKLAYVLSNIVILIGKEELVSADYLNRCYEFTRSANTNIADVPYLPVLIIIENKCSLSKKFGIDDVTEEFFRIHHAEIDGLSNYFSKIYCIRLPHTDQLQRVKGVVLDGKAIFEHQLNALQKVIQETIVKDRERLITHTQWLFLLRRVLDSVSNGKPVSIHRLLAEITSSTDNDEALVLARKFFSVMYSSKSIHTTEFYQQCREFAMKVFSRNLGIKLLQQEQILSDRFIRDTCKTQMPLMWDMLDEFKPCEALYTGKGLSISGNPVFCYQSKGAHPHHRTSEGINNTNWISSLFGWSPTEVWKGEFFSNDSEEISENKLESFSNLTIEYVNAFKQSSIEKIRTFRVFLQEVCIDTIPPVVETRCCSCCFKRKHPNKLPRAASIYMEIVRFMRSLTTFTVCKYCHDELSLLSVNDSSGENRNVILTKTSPGPKSQDENDCVICMTSKKDHALVPCGHRGFCLDCATIVQEVSKFCPICRAGVQSILKIHDI